MKSTRISRLIIITALLIAVIVALQVVNVTVISKESTQTYVGMGDLRRYEAQTTNRPYVGMGDLRRYEAQTTSRPYVGMGDLRRFEAMQEQRDSAQSDSISP